MRYLTLGMMLLFLGALLLASLDLSWVRQYFERRAAKAAREAERDPEPDAKPLPEVQAVLLSRDPLSGTITLTNIAPHAVWFQGYSRREPCPSYEQLLPDGKWAMVCDYPCGTGIEWQALAPGVSVALPGYSRRLEKSWAPAVKQFLEQNGDLDKVPARAGLLVTCNPGPNKRMPAPGVIVYSIPFMPNQ